MMQGSSPFRKLAETWNQSTLLVLDLDSSLVLTHKRNEAILHQYAKDFKKERPEFCATLAKVDCQPCEYGYYTALKRVGLDTAKKEDLEALATYWREHFFSNRYLHHDIEHRGAVAFVNYLKSRSIPHVYLTGRPRDRMIGGTIETLNALGFKVGPENLYMKPESSMIDELFKAEKLKELKKGVVKVVLIDNEPKILNQVAMDLPDIQMIFVDTCHSPNVKAPNHVPSVKDFSDFL